MNRHLNLKHWRLFELQLNRSEDKTIQSVHSNHRTNWLWMTGEWLNKSNVITALSFTVFGWLRDGFKAPVGVWNMLPPVESLSPHWLCSQFDLLGWRHVSFFDWALDTKAYRWDLRQDWIKLKWFVYVQYVLFSNMKGTCILSHGGIWKLWKIFSINKSYPPKFYIATIDTHTHTKRQMDSLD